MLEIEYQIFDEERYSIVIDSNMNIYKVREKKMIECFDKLITPIDIYSQVANETGVELMQEQMRLDLQATTEKVLISIK